MRILVTGGAGFLGSHLCENFLALGHQVYCLDNLATGSRENVRHLEESPNFRFHLHDVAKPVEVEGEVHAVVHLASPASPRHYLRMPIQTLKAGSLGTHNALGLARAKRARFLLASSSEVYGDSLVHPQAESYWGHVNALGPRGVYNEAKRFAEALTLAYHRCHGVDTRIARIFNTYGPRMHPQDGRVISNFIVQALQGQKLTICGDGSQTRSFCYVSNLIEGLTRLLLVEPESGVGHEGGELEGIHGPVNLGSPVETKVGDLAQMVLQLISSCPSQIERLPLPADDPKVRCPDITRARKLLGWEPRTSLPDGLKLTIQYFSRLLKRSPIVSS